MVRLASTMPNLAHFIHIGGYRIGAVRPSHWKKLGAYERSKHEGNAAVMEAAKILSVPITFVHPSSVIGDSRTGETIQLTGVGELARALLRGKMPVLVGSPRSWIPLVPVDYVAQFVVQALHAPASAYWVLDPASPPLFELIQKMAAHFGVPAPHRVAPVRLVRLLPRFITGIESESLEFICEDHYPTNSAHTLATQAGLVMPSVDLYLPKWLDYLKTTDFVTRDITTA